jgi:hypothetical protein
MTSAMNSRVLPGGPGLPQRPNEGFPITGSILPPPRPSSQASTDSDRRSSRTFASVQSILNPSGEDDEPRGRRRSAAQMEHDFPMSPTLPSLNNRPPSSGGLMIEKSPPGFQGSRPNAPRRILTPISPTLHRTTSLSRMIPGTIDAQSTPFLANPNDSSRPPSSEPGSAGLPTLPPFPGQHSQRQSFSHSQAPTPPLQAVARRKSVSVLPSARASPSPSYSSYSRSGQASPSLPYPSSSGPTPPGPLSLNGSPIIGPMNPLSPGFDQDGHPLQGISVVSGGQNQYEYFNLPTGKGYVSVPVEVQIASRQADEKRKRNAGASARFRQRRKEKEREANHTIDRLRDDLRIATEDCEYYASERDRLIEVLKQTPGWEHHLPRSPSPRSKRRAQSTQTASSGMTSGGVSPTSPQSTDLHHPSDMERNTRRRIDSESYQPSSSHQDGPAQQQYPSQYPPFSPRHATQHPGTHSHHLPMVEQNHNHPPQAGYERASWAGHPQN